MKRKCLFLLVALCLAACHESAPEEVVKESLKAALEALERGDYEEYLQHVDMGAPMDSVQRAVMLDALRQHQEWKGAERPSVVAVDVVDAQFEDDSVCLAYCQYTFADSTKEVVWHKMIRHGDEWKIRLRN